MRRFLDRCPEKPNWCECAVEHWARVLRSLRADPLQLCDQLDPFIKLTLLDAALEELGHDWQDLAGNCRLYHKIALIDVAYHQLSDASPFTQLDQEGALRHQILPSKTIDSLPAIVDRLRTRAAPRARLIAKLSGSARVQCYWNALWRKRPAAWIDLGDPTQTNVPDWQEPDENWPYWL